VVEEADLPVRADQEGQGNDPTPHAQADEAVAGVVGPTVRIGGALPVGPVAARLQNVATAVRATIGVGSADVLRWDATPDGLIAGLPAPAVVVGSALGAGLENRQAELALSRAVGVDLAADAGSVAPADAIGAIPVVGADDAGAGDAIARRRVARALCGVHAVDAAVVDHVASLPGAVRVHAASGAGSGREVADPRGAVGVDDAPDTGVARPIADRPRRAVAVLEAAVARLIQAAVFAAGAVGVDEALRAAMRLDDAAPPVRAVRVLETGHTAGGRVAVLPGTTVRVVQARGAASLRDPTTPVRTLCVLGALDAGADRAADPPHRAIGVGGTVHTNGVVTTSALPAVLVDRAPHAPMFPVAGRDAAAIDVGPARDAGLVLADARCAMGVVEAGHTAPAAGVTAGLRAIRVVEASHTLRGRRIAAGIGAIPVVSATDTGVRGRVADPASAVLVERAVDADAARRVADSPAEAVAVPGTGDAGVRRGVADLVLGTLLSSSALDAGVRTREADAFRAVFVAEARDTDVAGAVAASAGALRVLGALHAPPAREVAHADGTMFLRHAVDADAPRDVTMAGLAALLVLDALPAEAPELGTAPRGRRTRVVLRIAGRRAPGPHRITDLTRRAGDGGAGLARPAAAVRRYAMALGTRERDRALGVSRTRSRAKTAVRELDAGRTGARALVIELAARARRLAEGSAAAGLRIAVLRLRTHPGDPAVGLERHADAFGNLTTLPERAVILRAATTRREDASPRARFTGAETAVQIRLALSLRRVPFRAYGGDLLGHVGAAGRAQDQHGDEADDDGAGIGAVVTTRVQQARLLGPTLSTGKRAPFVRRALTSPSALRVRDRRPTPKSAPS